MQPVRVTVPGDYVVVATCERDLDTGETMVEIHCGAALVIRCDPSTADRIADALVDLYAAAIVSLT